MKRNLFFKSKYVQLFICKVSGQKRPLFLNEWIKFLAKLKFYEEIVIFFHEKLNWKYFYSKLWRCNFFQTILYHFEIYKSKKSMKTAWNLYLKWKSSRNSWFDSFDKYSWDGVAWDAPETQHFDTYKEIIVSKLFFYDSVSNHVRFWHFRCM